LEESLLHSEEIIIKLQEEIKKVKTSKLNFPLKEIGVKENVKLSKSVNKLKGTTSSKLGLV
jgi:hypothetical protein